MNLYKGRCRNKFAAIEFQCKPSTAICENVKKWDLPGSRSNPFNFDDFNLVSMQLMNSALQSLKWCFIHISQVVFPFPLSWAICIGLYIIYTSVRHQSSTSSIHTLHDLPFLHVPSIIRVDKLWIFLLLSVHVTYVSELSYIVLTTMFVTHIVASMTCPSPKTYFICFIYHENRTYIHVYLP